jgi:hypothetical protein
VFMLPCVRGAWKGKGNRCLREREGHDASGRTVSKHRGEGAQWGAPPAQATRAHSGAVRILHCARTAPALLASRPPLPHSALHAHAALRAPLPGPADAQRSATQRSPAHASTAARAHSRLARRPPPPSPYGFPVV